jgi:hypothetical protein
MYFCRGFVLQIPDGIFFPVSPPGQALGPHELYLTRLQPCVPIGVSDFSMRKCNSPQDSRFLESQCAPYALTPLARLLTNVTTIPMTSILYSRRGFGVSNAKMHWLMGLPILESR